MRVVRAVRIVGISLSIKVFGVDRVAAACGQGRPLKRGRPGHVS